jgi:multimeric flavodoxin WrbA
MAIRKRKLVLALCGSPRVNGNTETLAKEVLAGARKAGARTRYVNVAKLKISPCAACYYCFSHGGTCAIRDDMQRIYGLLRKADAWVFATPVYWFTMSAQLKAPMDRMFAFLGCKRNPMKGKSAAVVTTSGDADARDMAQAAFDAFAKGFKFTGVKFAGRLAVQGVEREKARARWKGYKPARKLGAKLVR